jgi:hypothetical protein
VPSKSEFWLSLHKLAQDYRLEGATDDARIASLSELLASLPDATRQAYCDDLEVTLAALSALAVHCRRTDVWRN